MNKVMNTKNSIVEKNKANSDQRLEIAFDAEALATIDEIANSTHRDREEVVRDALGFYKWANLQYNRGFEIGSVRNGKAFRIAHLPRMRSQSESDNNTDSTNFIRRICNTLGI